MNIEAYSGSSPLHLACRSGNVSMVRRLLEKEASLYSKNVDAESVKDVAKNDEVGMFSFTDEFYLCTK